MPSSEEVLSSPARGRHPVLRSVLSVIAVGLVAWAVVARLSAGDPAAPEAAPPPRAPSTSPRAVPTGPPPWVRYPTPLEGSWVSLRADGRLNLVISNANLDLWLGTEQRPRARLLAHRTIIVFGDRVLVRVPGDQNEAATYRWRVEGDRLSLHVVERTPKSVDTLGGPAYERS